MVPGASSSGAYGMSWASCQPRPEDQRMVTRWSVKYRPKPGSARSWRLSFREVGGDRRLHRGGRVRVTEVIEPQRDRQDRRDRVGDALTGDVRRGAVHRLEHARVGPGDVEVAARRQPDTAGDGGAEVG